MGRSGCALGVVLAIFDGSNREAWLICAALGPIAIGLNYVVKLIVKRPRPVLEGLPPLGRRAQLAQLSLGPCDLFVCRGDGDDSGRAAGGACRSFWRFALALGRPYLGMHYPSDVLVGAVLGVALGLIVPLSL